MDPRENAIHSAIRDLESGVFPSKTAAAKAYNIPQTTLVSRLKDCTNACTDHQDQQRLTPLQEEFLAD